MPPGIKLRRATPADFDALRPLLESYFREGDVQTTDTPEALHEFLQQDTLGFSVAEANGELAGCVQCKPLPQREAACECKRLYVAPAWRGHGLGSQLMEFAEQQTAAAGYRWLYLDSKPVFAKAIEMYRAHGYEPCERFNEVAECTMFFRKQVGAQ